jgi:hypothetical protein
MQGHTPDEPSTGFTVLLLHYLAYFSLWLLLVALAGLLAWSLRINLFDLGIWLRWNPGALTAGVSLCSAYSGLPFSWQWKGIYARQCRNAAFGPEPDLY